VQAHGHAEDAELLDRLFQPDVPTVDRDALTGELLGDVGGRDRAEQLSLLASFDLEGHGSPLQLRRQALRPVLLPVEAE
jgi:hypothetical protein